jgi:hypothetical protein
MLVLALNMCGGGGRVVGPYGEVVEWNNAAGNIIQHAAVGRTTRAPQKHSGSDRQPGRLGLLLDRACQY